MSDANPFDQFDEPAVPSPQPSQPANTFDQFDANPHGAKVWSSSPLSLAPISQYADGSYGFDSNAGMLGAGKRLVEGAYNAVTGLPDLARRTGAETSENTATPETAGRVADIATMTTPGDMMAPGLSGKAVEGKIATPTEPELLSTGSADLKAARNTGVDYSIPHAVNLSNSVEQHLYNQGIGPADAPRTFAKLADARDIPPGAVAMPIDGLMGIRRGFSKLTADKSASDMDRAAAATALGHYQSFLENPPPEAVLAGPASTASDLVARGNANYSAGKRSQLVTNRGESADLQTGSTNSGRNYDNVLRQKLRPLVDPTNPQRFQLNSFTPDEVDMVKGVVRGSETPGQNRLRTIGNLGGGGHGIAATGLGIAAGMMGDHIMGPAGTAAGFAVPVAGSIARTVQNNNAKAAVEGLAEKLRQRSPLYQERAAKAPLTVNQNAPGMAAVRAISTPDASEQPQYAKGGKVKKPSHEYLVNRLMALAEKAKRAEKKAT